MSDKFLRLNGAELCRLFDADEYRMADNIESHLEHPRVFWNYEPGRIGALQVYAGVPLDEALANCAAIRNPIGRAQNELVIRLVHALLAGRKLRALPLPKRPLSFRSDRVCWLRPEGYIVEGGRLRVFWLQPRKTFAFDNPSLGMFASMLMYQYGRDPDFKGAGVEIIDVSAPKGSKERCSRLLRESDLPVLSNSELASRFKVIAAAIDIIIDRWRESGKYAEDTIQGRLFER